MGNEEHDEEIAYLRQILSSPVTQEVVKGKVGKEETSKFVQATTEVLSGIHNSEEDEDRITPAEKKKRQVAR